RQPVIRQMGFVALITVDGGVEKAWKLGTGSVSALRDLVSSVQYVPDASLRAAMYPRIVPLLENLPSELPATSRRGGTIGRYVRIELPTTGTLTLAEVEVYCDGRNVAPQGTASQKNTAHGGDAKRAIDGNKNGSFGAGGQTHSQENTQNPWWEVDLREDRAIDKIAVYNRTDAELGNRLQGFTLKVLDAAR